MTTLQPLREFEILLIICAIIFLALMLLGIGCSYYCLQKRNIKVIRRRPASTLGSEITKASEPISGFTGLKIPRPTADPASGTDEMTESIRTDFASEVASLESEEEYTSAYSDKLCVLAEGVIATRVAEPPMPRFDVDMIVRDGRGGAITPVMSSASSETGTILNAQEQYLTTVLERTETNTLETLERVRRAKAAAAAKQQIPVHARINVRQRDEPMSAASGTDDTMSEYSHATELYSEQEIEVESRPMRNFAIVEEDETMETKTEMRREDMTMHGDNRDSRQHMTVTVRSGGAEGGAARRRSSANMSNFDVLFRIVTVTDDYGGAAVTTDQDELSSIFTSDERRAIRRALEHDSHLQTELRSTYERTEFRQLMSA